MCGETELVEFRQAPRHVLGGAHGLHGDEADSGLMRGVERLVKLPAFFVKRIKLEHDDVEKAAGRRRVQIIRQQRVVAGKTDHLDLPGFFQCRGGGFVNVALRPVQPPLPADAVNVKRVEIRRAAGFQPLVNQVQHFRRAVVRIILGDQENFLPALWVFGEPRGEDLFRLAIEIAVRRVEIADAHGPGDVNVVRAQRRHHAAHAQHGDLRTVLAKLSARQRGGRGRIGGHGGLRQQRRRGGERDRQGHGGFEKVAAGGGGMRIFHGWLFFKN